MNLSTKHKQIHRDREQTWGCQGGGTDWEFGISRWKLLYREWMNSKVLPYNRELYSISCDKP